MHDAEERQDFGELLRRYRLAAGLTQEALAERTGLGVRSIKHLEGGAHLPFSAEKRGPPRAGGTAHPAATGPGPGSRRGGAGRPRWPPRHNQPPH